MKSYVETPNVKWMRRWCFGGFRASSLLSSTPRPSPHCENTFTGFLLNTRQLLPLCDFFIKTDSTPIFNPVRLWLGCWTSRRVRRLAYETHRCTNITSAVMGTHSQTNTNAQFSIWVSSLLHFLPECTGRTVPSLLRMAWAKARLCI